MVLRFAGLVALAVLSSACAYRTQTTARTVALDSSNHAQYDPSFGASPSRPAPIEGAAFTQPAETSERQDAIPDHGNALGFPADSARTADTLTAEASDTEYEEVEATPGTACYDAALKAGIARGTCTLVRERTFLLVGEKAR